MPDWIAVETRGADFGDARLDARLPKVLRRLSEQPTRSIPAACQDPAEIAAAYRFCANPKATPDKVLAPHARATLDRVRAHPVVLVVQDTTEIDLTRAEERVGGPLSDDGRCGLFAHPVLALTPDRVPLGVLAADLWSREPAGPTTPAADRRRDRKAKPIEDKESFRWLTGYRVACAAAAAAPGTRVIAVSDSEGDIYECLQAGEAGAAGFLIRACQDRAVLADGQPHLFDALAEKKSLGRFAVRVRKRPATTGPERKRRRPRAARTAKLTVRTARVRLRGPMRPGGKLADLTVHVVLAQEDRPPAGADPVVWVLFTSLPVGTFAEARQVLDYYACRWEIEVFFRTLKSGCRVEALQFERQDRYEVCLAVYLIVAWRVLYLLMRGRTAPRTRCTAVLTAAEWQVVYVLAHGRVPKVPPPLGEMIVLIAKLGGYLGRKADGPPGPKALWIGLQRMRDYATAWTAFGSKKAGEDV
jgi:hypothetical protein